MMRRHSASARLPMPAVGISDEHDPPHALGILLGAIGDDTDHDVRRVRSGFAVDDDEPVVDQVVLLEVTVRDSSAGEPRRRCQRLRAVRRGRQPTLAEPDDVLLVRPERPDRPLARASGPGSAIHRQSARTARSPAVPLDRSAVGPVRAPGPSAGRARPMSGINRSTMPATSSVVRSRRGQTYSRMRLYTRRRSAGRVGLNPTDRSADLVDHALHFRKAQQPTFVVAHRGEIPYLGNGEEAFVMLVVVGDPAEQVDVLRCGDAGDGEVLEALQLAAASPSSGAGRTLRPPAGSARHRWAAA